ncbi:lasso peptide isopeptide bond-forming cyclase [Metabacillus sediminilitoris]|uniref:asparagine synthase (glutamine-hydrolyzing) n=1 Tax=Metabacillus sediminilitoris TaxID=2567941 RepID=A0A4S4BZ45_9BACI|nr:lasso peptide isopeptide bond-forming cyclase [Metabacillus sediminilitoris]QGQ47213.1 lasso peptide isopeptide bond-forming cyclase [Metabacillus sediminilitoris]THF80557.1 lasso peptide isopeptide bond-forming cyclase [Metabacillus sediminilitoris]
MSAVAGIYHLNEEPIDLEQAGKVMKALQKFPADDVRTWNDENIFLGCHLQWITPESVGELLPYYDTERKAAITADAIIDNREELFERLQVPSFKRSSITDSELILLSYYKWGEDSPKYLVGDFAYMIWDGRKRLLFGARDFSGTRTLYYYQNRGKFAFCTVIAPLLSLPYLHKQLNEQWLAEYLVISGTIDAVDSNITPYKNIEQLPPAHSITVSENKISLSRYCTITPGEKLKLTSDNEYVEAFHEVFQKAVNSRLRTHLNVGAQLSGGLDSGAVVSFARKAMKSENKIIHTFSYIPAKGFKDFTPKQLVPDERPFVHSTVKYVGGINDHYLDFGDRNSYSEIDSLLEVLEMPYKYFENSFWLKGMFEEAKEKDVGVLLNGDRGNFTISWGSALNYYAILLKKFKWFRLFQELDLYSEKIGGARLGLIPVIARVGFPIIDKIIPQGKPYRLPTIINPEFAEKSGVYKKLKKFGIQENGWYPKSNLYNERKRHFEDIFQWNASNTLAAKLSLHYSISKRDPTNDIRVIRYCLSLPEDQYVKNGLDRALIRRATENLLPDNVRLNQRARGVQGVDWIYRMIPYWDTFLDELQQLINDKRVLEFIDGDVIKTALTKTKEGASIEYATNPDYKILMRCLIVYRFLKKFA